MSEYKLSQTDIPWAKHFEGNQLVMPLPEGTRAIVPHPEQEGYLELTYERYKSIMSGLTRSASTLVDNQNYLEGKRYQDALPPSRVAVHAIGDAVYIQRESEQQTNERGDE